MLEIDIKTRMNAHAGLSALISTRSYPFVLPQNPIYPSITYDVISTVVQHAFGSDPGNFMKRIQFTIWDSSYSVLKTVRSQLLLCFSRWKGVQANVTIEDVFYENEIDEYDSETRDKRLLIDFMFFYRE